MARKNASSDFKAHEDTYNGFITVSKWAIIALAVTMVVLYFVINP